MTFQQLTYVVEISKCGSINKAAQKLFLSQSGISTAVRELEEELGRAATLAELAERMHLPQDYVEEVMRISYHAMENGDRRDS